MGRALVWCVVFFGRNSTMDNEWCVAPVGVCGLAARNAQWECWKWDRRAPRCPVTLSTPLYVAQLLPYIRLVFPYSSSPLYPPCSCPSTPNTFPLDSRLVRLRLS
ncbi:hypothetical protein K438DRAFT_1876275, partial [Mycena galopus ATCC 62051]